MTKKIKLLEKLIKDSSKTTNLYKPSPYWYKKNVQSYEEIKKKGIYNFRGSDNNIGHSFSDNQNLNILNDYYGGLRGFLKLIFENSPFIRSIFLRQITLTSSFKKLLNLYKSKYLENDRFTNDLSEKFILKNTTNFGCEDYIIKKNQKISNYYLGIADTHQNFSNKIDFKFAKTFFEIGGGFGANIHFLVENYKNLKKFIYLDLPINLYVATEYLKSIYGTAVKDYVEIEKKEIFFENNENLEIICIPPWKIADIKCSFDIFQNSNSFIEMSEEIINNYVFFVKKIMNHNSKILISSYIDLNNKKIINPEKLINLWDMNFETFYAKSIIPDRENIYFISK